MKILHINQFDSVGGAAIAAYRLHQGLLKQKIDSKLLVGNIKIDGEDRTLVPPLGWLSKRLYRWTHQAGLNEIHYLDTFKIPNNVFFQEADILNFHNLHTGYFNYLAIPQLTKFKPGILTLHDMWSFTGHCMYSYECERWKIGCGQCPHLNDPPAVVKDNTNIEWKLKKWVYANSKLNIVTLSNWLTKEVQQSILKQFPIHHIPNGIDVNIYHPIDVNLCRSALKIPHDKKVLMCSAVNLNDSRKGSDLIIKVLQQIPESLKSKLVLITLGEGGEKMSQMTGLQVISLGYISSDRIKALAYSAADLFLFSSRADNLPLVLQEAMSCGTPMIAFDVGGVGDLVRHYITGYLCSCEDIDDFSHGIQLLLENDELRQKIQHNCRDISLREYSLELQVSRYIKLYKEVSIPLD